MKKRFYARPGKTRRNRLLILPGLIALTLFFSCDPQGYSFKSAQFLPVVGLQPMFVTADQVKIAWRNIDENTESYTVERSIDGTTWEAIAEDLSEETYEDNGVQAGTDYRYRVVSRNASGGTQVSPLLKVSTYAASLGPKGTTGNTFGYGLTKEYTKPWVDEQNLGYAPAYTRLTVDALAPSINDVVWDFGVTRGFAGGQHPEDFIYTLEVVNAKENLIDQGESFQNFARQVQFNGTTTYTYSATEYFNWKEFAYTSQDNLLADSSGVVQSENLSNFGYQFLFQADLFTARNGGRFYYSMHTSPLAPQPPSNLNATYDNGYQLNWTASPLTQEEVNNPHADNAAITVDTDAPSGYVVEYSNDEGETWLSLGFVAAYDDEGQYIQAPSFFDDHRAQGLAYRVKAVNYTGESTYLTE